MVDFSRIFVCIPKRSKLWYLGAHTIQ